MLRTHDNAAISKAFSTLLAVSVAESGELPADRGAGAGGNHAPG